MGKAYFTRNQRLYYRGRTSNLDVLDVKAMFFVDAAVNRHLDMIRATADVGNSDSGKLLSRNMQAPSGNRERANNYEAQPSKHYIEERISLSSHVLQPSIAIIPNVVNRNSLCADADKIVS